jgi:hypothetical protein
MSQPDRQSPLKLRAALSRHLDIKWIGGAARWEELTRPARAHWDKMSGSEGPDLIKTLILRAF